ncbi:MAG: type II toxin-antitoxin system RelE/ParE family toxin [Ignavibacteriales bacterium]|nr:type II toxin-antitoxin system RelE/ParE family toxin [Ignavibacteriales bacterium]
MSRPEYDVRLLRVAEDDLTEIISYIDADRPSAAENVASRIEKNLSLLSKTPRLGRIPKEEGLVRLGYRYLVVDNYLIFYTVEQETVFVHRILHGARDYLRLF